MAGIAHSMCKCVEGEERKERGLASGAVGGTLLRVSTGFSLTPSKFRIPGRQDPNFSKLNEQNSLEDNS